MSNTLIFTIKGEDYFSRILDKINLSQNKVCFVTFNKTCGSLVDALKDEKVSIEKIRFVDCISPMLMKVKKLPNCDFITGLSNLQSIISFIKKRTDEGYRMVIIDSLSNLINSGNSDEKIIAFVKATINYISEHEGEVCAVCSKDDEGSSLMENIYPLFDELSHSFLPIGVSKTD